MKKMVKTFTSFEDAKAYEDEQEKALTPIQRIVFTVELIRRSFQYDPAKTKNRKIKLLRYE